MDDEIFSIGEGAREGLRELLDRARVGKDVVLKIKNTEIHLYLRWTRKDGDFGYIIDGEMDMGKKGLTEEERREFLKSYYPSYKNGVKNGSR